MFETLITLMIISLIVGGALLYIAKAKKSGQKCIGCPSSKTCSGNCSADNQDTEASNDNTDLEDLL
ncbi:MAG: FeoB-associated Cys-rich membrane protein [Clostridia bacterium]|nr:FeoB-associated Cys-rich membrane protein [Clostridia bacterium]